MCMATRSGTQYYPHDPTSDMESLLANITKLLENLTTRMNDVEREETLRTERLPTMLVIMTSP